jgi:hypothetical protein
MTATITRPKKTSERPTNTNSRSCPYIIVPPNVRPGGGITAGLVVD